MKNTEAAFSLIELFVVVSMIAILAAIAMPNFQDFKTNAYNAVARSDFANFKTAAKGEDMGEDVLRYFQYMSNGSNTGTYMAYENGASESGSFSLDSHLPGPLSHMSLSPGSIPRMIFRYEEAQNGIVADYTYVWIDHEKSSQSYRYVHYIDSSFVIYTGDQVIQK